MDLSSHNKIANQSLNSEGYSNSLLIFVCYSLLTAIGLLTLHSANYSYYLTHLKHIFLGFTVLIIVGWKVPLKTIQSFTYGVHFLFIVCLCLVLLLGYTAGGAKRWLSLGFFRFQPSEFIKITVALTVAHFFYTHKLKTYYLIRDILPILFVSFLVFALIFMQPDFGTAGLCLAISLSQITFINLRISNKSIFALAFGSVTLPILGWLFFSKALSKIKNFKFTEPGIRSNGIRL